MNSFLIPLRRFGSGLLYYAYLEMETKKLPKHIYCWKRSLWINSDLNYQSGVKSNDHSILEFFHTVFSTQEASYCAE